MRTLIYKIIAILVIVSSTTILQAQISSGGFPPEFNNRQELDVSKVISFDAPDYKLLKSQDEALSTSGLPERVGITVPANITPTDSDKLINYDNRRSGWRAMINVKGATGLTLYFSDFYIAPGDELFIYSADKSHLIGAFTEKNNRKYRLFATELVKGDNIIVELVMLNSNGMRSTFTISEVLVAYKPMRFNTIKADDGLKMNDAADECEVNINCVEGDGWRQQADGVIRIMTKVGNTAFWCTGSVVNNTSLDFAPYILTADHCASNNNLYSTPTDVAHWVFYFKHESRSCTDNTALGTRSMTGAVKLASSSPYGNNGSDFYLLELMDMIPNSYSPYYQGWSALPDLSNNGVAIHHPEGDVKKISTYRTPVSLSQWGNVAETHLRVRWNSTSNGHGVTEGGSSGAPLFNTSKLIIGQLTGGESECTNLTGSDYFGRFYYSWNRNGTPDSVKLQLWLDPINTGLLVLDGSYNTKVAIGQFTASETTIPVGSYIRYTDLSRNNPDSWRWNFEGGTPASSDSRDPGIIYYNQLGVYDVMLVVENEFGEDSVLIRNYIKVVPAVYPNPTTGNAFILFGNDQGEHQIIIHSGATGSLVDEFMVPAGNTKHEYSFSGKAAGLYIITVKSESSENHYKLLYTPFSRQ